MVKQNNILRSFKKTIFVFLVILLNGKCFSQKTIASVGLWKLTSLSGKLGVDGFYRDQERILGSGFFEEQNTTHFLGGLHVNTRSYVWHPNFLLLDVDAAYEGQTGKEEFLVTPDRSETGSLKKLSVRATIFEQKFITINSLFNLNQNYTSRENLSSIRSNQKQWGASLAFRKKILPFSVSYSESEWKQKELQRNRTFTNWQRNFQGNIRKSFSDLDDHELSYSHNEYRRQEFNLFETKTKIDNINLRNNIFLDAKKNYQLYSIITNFTQSGNYSFKRFQVLENLSFQLPYNFKFKTNYQYSNEKRQLHENKRHNVKSDLEHQLFSSLKTNLSFEYHKLEHSLFKESSRKSGVSLDYKKKIPTGGQLRLSYRYLMHQQSRDSDPVALPVSDEVYTLSDDRMLLLKQTHIDPNSVTVKDVTGTIIYESGFDYLLIERGVVMEIQRVPGGRIENGANIFVDYVSIQSGAFSYDSGLESFSADLSLFRNFFTLYFNSSELHFKDIKASTDILVLKHFKQNIYGLNFSYSIAEGGIEFDEYKSNIVPYRMWRYYARLQWKYNGKLLLSFSGNLRDFKRIDEKTDRQYFDISAKAAYQFNRRTKLNLESNYRDQKGEGVELDLLTAKAELSTHFGQLFVSGGVELYRRDFLLSNELNFFGAFFKIERKF